MVLTFFFLKGTQQREIMIRESIQLNRDFGSFVHNVPTVKAGKRNPNVKYYNMMLQSQDEIYRSVSYNKEIRSELLNVQNHK